MASFNYQKFIGLHTDVIALRTDVFMQEQGFQNEFDETDKTCTHLVLYAGKTPIATCRYFGKDTHYHIGRVAVKKEYRGQNLGSKMMLWAEQEIKKEGGTAIELSAQVRVQSFYQKLGYAPSGAPYLDEYCQHITMIKKL